MRRALIAGLVLAAAMIGPSGGAMAADDKALLNEGRAAAKICHTCHHFKRAKRKFGPHLVDIIGRPVASAAPFQYSDALNALGGVWTEERLAEFVNHPEGYAPGTNMKFKGFQDERKARAAVAYLIRRYGSK